VPAQLVAGSYVLTPIPPRAGAEGGWKLAFATCDGHQQPAPDGSLLVQVGVAAPDRQCTATYEFVPAARLQVVLQAEGDSAGRAGAATLEVSCVDGSAGRVVLGVGNGEPEPLPDPLTFLEPTRCTVRQPGSGVAPGSTASATGQFDNVSDEQSLRLPTEFDVGSSATALTLTVTVRFTVVAQPPRRSTPGLLTLVPALLLGAGLLCVAVGVLAIRRRRRRAAMQ
jgi:hypothetical protein